MLIHNAPDNETSQTVAVQLRADAPRRLRIDHQTGQPRPTFIVQLTGPGTNGKKEISAYLTPPGADKGK